MKWIAFSPKQVVPVFHYKRTFVPFCKIIDASLETIEMQGKKDKTKQSWDSYKTFE
jgi:hypothetical protein